MRLFSGEKRVMMAGRFRKLLVAFVRSLLAYGYARSQALGYKMENVMADESSSRCLLWQHCRPRREPRQKGIGSASDRVQGWLVYLSFSLGRASPLPLFFLFFLFHHLSFLFPNSIPLPRVSSFFFLLFLHISFFSLFLCFIFERGETFCLSLSFQNFCRSSIRCPAVC